jgi:hypothetical protein
LCCCKPKTEPLHSSPDKFSEKLAKKDERTFQNIARQKPSKSNGSFSSFSAVVSQLEVVSSPRITPLSFYYTTVRVLHYCFI